jgi:simple sugar transport system permease protein
VETVAITIASILSSATILALAGLGLLINEKAGLLNLGAEGMMLCAALAGFAMVFYTGNNTLGFISGMLAGALLASIYGFLVVFLNTQQTVTGLSLTIFGSGLAAFLGSRFTGQQIEIPVSFSIPFLGDIPFLGMAIFSLHPMAYIAILLILVSIWFLYQTRTGLILRAVGESPETAYTLGYPVRGIRLLAVLTGGALCGLAGAYLSIIHNSFWVEGITGGRGWIALALIPFSTWRPTRLGLGAIVFATVTVMAFEIQAIGIDIPIQLLNASPYMATIIVLVVISRNANWIRVNKPDSLGKPFYIQ